MSKKVIKYFFDRYARNWEIVKPYINPPVQPDVKDVFLCPLCFEQGGYLRDAIEDNLLSLEHLPPKKLGGQVKTLTCKECNNQAGTILDSQLIRERLFNEFTLGIPGSSYDAKYRFNNRPSIDATVVRPNADTWQIVGDPKRHNDRDVKIVSDILRSVSNPKDLTISLSFRLQKVRHSEVALLRIAYLWAFSVYGYAFLFNANSKVVCNQINNPQQQILPTWEIFNGQDIPDEAVGVNLIYEPKELQAFLIVFDLITQRKTKTRHGVILPTLRSNGFGIYQQLLDHNKKTINFKIKATDKNFDFIERSPFAAIEVWDNF